MLTFPHDFFLRRFKHLLYILIWKPIGGKVIFVPQAVEASYNEGRVATVQSLEEAIADEKKAQWRAEGQELLVQAKKENVLLQLEAAYRQRLMDTYTEVLKLKETIYLTVIAPLCSAAQHPIHMYITTCLNIHISLLFKGNSWITVNIT